MPENELQFIKQRIEEKKRHEDIRKPEELLIKETITERIEEGLKNFPPTGSGNLSDLSSLVNKSIKGDDLYQKKVQELLKIAIEKNIPYAVNLARKIGDYSLIDGLHDALVKYYIEHSLEDKL